MPYRNIPDAAKAVFLPVQYETPSSDQTIIASPGTGALILNPNAQIQALTITLPSINLLDGQFLTITSTQKIIKLTLNGGNTIGELNSLSANSFASFVYHSTQNTWFRCG